MTSFDQRLANEARRPTRGGNYAWEFAKRSRSLKVRDDGQLVVNKLAMGMNAVRAGLSVTYMPEDLLKTDVAQGRLIQGAGRLVRSVLGLSPLLSKPASTGTGVRAACRCASISGPLS